MCLYPKLIKNKKYQSNKKNGGIIPPMVDKRVELVPVGCGKCMECMRKKANEWRVRLLQETKDDRKGKFVTLTFTNEALIEIEKKIEKGKGIGTLEGYDIDIAITSYAIRHFLERWRKITKKSVKHWLITELGHKGTERIHLHGIIYTNNTELIKEKWTYGNVWIGDYCNEQTINYMIKYVHKVDEKHKYFKPKIYCSNGIGKGYLNTINAQKNKYKKGETKESFKTKSGHTLQLPIYYRNNIYNEEEREKLWLEKLDKEERWIDGSKIDAKNEEQYYKALQEARVKNKRLGYGDDEINWSKRKYENERRNLIKLERIKKRK